MKKEDHRESQISSSSEASDASADFDFDFDSVELKISDQDYGRIYAESLKEHDAIMESVYPGYSAELLASEVLKGMSDGELLVDLGGGIGTFLS